MENIIFWENRSLKPCLLKGYGNFQGRQHSHWVSVYTLFFEFNLMTSDVDLFKKRLMSNQKPEIREIFYI